MVGGALNPPVEGEEGGGSNTLTLQQTVGSTGPRKFSFTRKRGKGSAKGGGGNWFGCVWGGGRSERSKKVNRVTFKMRENRQGNESNGAKLQRGGKGPIGWGDPVIKDGEGRHERGGQIPCGGGNPPKKKTQKNWKRTLRRLSYPKWFWSIEKGRKKGVAGDKKGRVFRTIETRI